MNEQRDFKGVWFPREVWLDTRLTALEKMILAEVDSLDGEDGCFASNQYLADFCQCSVTKVSTAISKLVGLDYLQIQSFNGRTRILKSRLSKNERQDFKKGEADFQKVKQIEKEEQQKQECLPTISPEAPEAPKIGLQELFERFWFEYPRKTDKKKSERAFSRIANIRELFPEIMQALERQKRSDQWTKDGGIYIPHPTTWLNGERWKDEVLIRKPKHDEIPSTFDYDDFFKKAVEKSYENETGDRKWH